MILVICCTYILIGMVCYGWFRLIENTIVVEKGVAFFVLTFVGYCLTWPWQLWDKYRTLKILRDLNGVCDEVLERDDGLDEAGKVRVAELKSKIEDLAKSERGGME